ncbi:T9SS type A sorting domain-containing protein [Flavobacterium faecale]|uniref:T9SS type A sorting domain-containing protein n=1 Tax=Flavobacterium faecale TaxID=1355330 RepID=UPI003AAB593B
MKKNYFTLITLLILNYTSAQVVSIPDANFKALLLAADTNNSIAFYGCNRLMPIKIDVNNNGEIEESEAAAVQELVIDNANISNLEGISYFTSLTELSCQNNLFSSIDISGISELVSLNLDNNPNLVSINVKNNKIIFSYPNSSFTAKPMNSFPPAPCGINGVSIINCPNLNAICIGESFQEDLTSYLTYYNITGISYTCTTLENSDFDFTDYFTIYPNPVKETLHINSTKTTVIKDVVIYDTLGKFIKNVSNSNDYSVIDVSYLATGNYILKISTDKGISTAKFVKKK